MVTDAAVPAEVSPVCDADGRLGEVCGEVHDHRQTVTTPR